ncbi:MAG: SulP family inorganic anion transporter [Lachnospiraceae bacterium]|nr:SulP family inorganic anion transporter [Lachnospiraceae bacterium]
MLLFTQIKKDRKSIAWGKDIFAGIVVALVSIPISMGYAQIAGLPPVYGLYGSLLPILLYGLLTTSKQFVIGVDAMPAAMVGGMLAEMSIAEQNEILDIVPIITLFTAIWFFIFYFCKAGRIVNYISMPVMGGFISGVGLTIILMQVPKLYGGAPGTGEAVKLIGNIIDELFNWNLLSAILGVGTIVILLVCKKLIPKIPMTVVMMCLGAFLQIIFGLDSYGVKMMPQVDSGLPSIVFPDFSVLSGRLPDTIITSLGIAGVIMAQTLLASGNYARKYHEKLNSNQELLAYGVMNLAGASVGCCPINGSVSRSGISDSMGCHSQVMSVSASITMLFVLLFGTPLLKYLPAPMLTGIVITALIGILETDLAIKLWKRVKNEWIVFMVAFASVLFLGTLYGVIIGVLLSLWEVAIRASSPPTAFVGRIPGHGNFYSLKRNRYARAIKNTIVYRFSGNLFFANIDFFCDSIEQAIKEDTHQVVVDARAIGSVDITATERLVKLNTSLRKRGILFYIAEHDGSLNDQLRRLGGASLIDEGVVKRTITLALSDAGLEKPYDLEPGEDGTETFEETDASQHEHDWAFGKDKKQ